MIDINKLRRLAEEQQWIGRWYDAGCETLMAERNGEHEEVAHLTPIGLVPYLVAVQPATISELLGRLEAAETELAELRSSMKFRTSLIGRTEAERDDLRAKITEMEKQEPVAWMQSTHLSSFKNRLCGSQSSYVHCSDHQLHPDFKPLHALPGAQAQLAPSPAPVCLRSLGSQAVMDVAAEWRRQIEVEGWTSEHDDWREWGDLARAAACYALHVAGYRFDDGAMLRFWPWLESRWKPSTPRRDLIKAGALLLAEIERLDRDSASKNVPSEQDESVRKAWVSSNNDAQPAPSFADAYQGAMEEVAIWKKRALEAEDLNRKFVAEINGPAYMGEPAQPAPIEQDTFVRKAWARFSNELHRSHDAPYPGMSEAFEQHFSQSFTDREWRAESATWAAAWKAAKRHEAQAQPAPSIPEGVKKVTRGFYWNSGAQCHVPTLEVEFESVPAGSPNNAKGWQDRDRLAAMLAAAPEARP